MKSVVEKLDFYVKDAQIESVSFNVLKREIVIKIYNEFRDKKMKIYFEGVESFLYENEFHIDYSVIRNAVYLELESLERCCMKSENGKSYNVFIDLRGTGLYIKSKKMLFTLGWRKYLIEM
ncbi:MAG: hypothetical protein ACRC6X_05095 [Culicoidibacterales bacterium]